MMPIVKPLQIPASKKWKYLYVFCGKCNTVVSDFCKEVKGEEKPIQKCVYGHKQFYKLIVPIPGEKYARKTKKLDTRDINETIRVAIDFEREVKGGVPYITGNREKRREVKKEEIITKPHLLIHALAKYVSWLKNEGVAPHLIKERSPEHIKDVERAVELLVQCFKDRRYDLNAFSVLDITDNTVGEVFSHLENKKFANRTFNKYFGYYTSFLMWYAEEYNSPVRNFFERVKRKKLNPNPQAITHNEYEALLKQITPENGIREYKTGVKPVRNMYHKELKNGIRLLLETGLRREEGCVLKWNQIKESEGIEYIRQEDIKTNRIQNRKTEEEKKYKYVPVTDSLRLLLNELDKENKYRNTDNYILAPELRFRKKLPEILTRGFSHYYNLLNTGRKLTLKSLRKAYITQADLFLSKGNVKDISGHSGDQIIETNYIDKTARVKAARHFSVFPKESERVEELKKIRAENKNKQQQIDREV